MNHRLTKDEFDALGQVSKNPRASSACVARNTKRLAGLKYLAYGRDGSLTLTEKGQQTLYVQNCVDGLRAVAADPLAKLAPDIVTFLAKKGYIDAAALPARCQITPRGQECLADIDATQP